jgi:hypothetical protein
MSTEKVDVENEKQKTRDSHALPSQKKKKKKKKKKNTTQEAEVMN